MRERSPLRPRRVPMSLIVTVASSLIAGCASLANTPAQDTAWSRWTACQAQVRGADLRTIQQDGRIFFWYSGPENAQDMLACLRRAGNGGATLPEPIADPRPGGGGGGGM
jgi:hypothetical protein